MVGIASLKDVKKFCLHDILRDFTATIKELSTNGITIKIGDENIVIKGDLIYAVCDTPAGEFKEGSAFAEKPSRRCNGSKSEIKESFDSNNFVLQDMQNHIRQCKVLEDRRLTKFEFAYKSKIFGINNSNLSCWLVTVKIVTPLKSYDHNMKSTNMSCEIPLVIISLMYVSMCASICLCFRGLL